MRQSRKSQSFVFRQRAAIQRPQKIIQQALPGCRVVEDVPNQSCFRRLLDKIVQAFGGRIQTLEKESIDGRITSRQLRRMQIPTLVETSDERMLNVIVMKFPGAMDDGAVFIDL